MKRSGFEYVRGLAPYAAHLFGLRWPILELPSTIFWRPALNSACDVAFTALRTTVVACASALRIHQTKTPGAKRPLSFGDADARLFGPSFSYVGQHSRICQVFAL